MKGKEKEKFETNTLNKKPFKLDFLPFPSFKYIHNSIKEWLVILNLKIKARKGPNQKKIDLRMFCENSLWFTISSES